MKKQINEIKRMQQLAGLITESEYQESLMSDDDDMFEKEEGEEFSDFKKWKDALFKAYPFIKGNEKTYFHKSNYDTKVGKGYAAYGSWHDSSPLFPNAYGILYSPDEKYSWTDPVKGLEKPKPNKVDKTYKTEDGKISQNLIDDLDNNITYQFPSRFKSGETIKRELDPEELVGDSSIEKIWKAIQDLGGKITFKSPKNSLMFKNIDMTFTSTPDGKVQYSVKVP